jgi:hypothetical protein
MILNHIQNIAFKSFYQLVICFDLQWQAVVVRPVMNPMSLLSLKTCVLATISQLLGMNFLKCKIVQDKIKSNKNKYEMQWN